MFFASPWSVANYPCSLALPARTARCASYRRAVPLPWGFQSFRPGTLRHHLSVDLPLSVLRLWRNAGTRKLNCITSSVGCLPQIQCGLRLIAIGLKVNAVAVYRQSLCDSNEDRNDCRGREAVVAGKIGFMSNKCDVRARRRNLSNTKVEIASATSSQ